MQEITRLAYAGLFELLRGLDYPHALRLWNYLPDIHASNAGAERYEQFNAGRQDAFLRAGRRLMGEVPAASVLGVRATPLVNLYGLATREAPLPVENPRQCSAWDYPRQYGERRPTFARACIDRTGGARLFISGTASILGHHSEHPGDPAAQTRETLRNIRALLTAANERVGARRFTERDLAYKIYVRHPQDQPAIEGVLREELGDDPLCLFLRADVCRPELLVEIEAASV
jgi:enamine deaminase RidA (YjgF/YER057c/UK114 family)